MDGINGNLVRSNPGWACAAIGNMLEAWWHLRGILGDMRWTVEEGNAIALMDDRVKDLDPSFDVAPDVEEETYKDWTISLEETRDACGETYWRPTVAYRESNGLPYEGWRDLAGYNVKNEALRAGRFLVDAIIAKTPPASA